MQSHLILYLKHPQQKCDKTLRVKMPYKLSNIGVGLIVREKIMIP